MLSGYLGSKVITSRVTVNGTKTTHKGQTKQKTIQDNKLFHALVVF